MFQLVAHASWHNFHGLIFLIIKNKCLILTQINPHWIKPLQNTSSLIYLVTVASQVYKHWVSGNSVLYVRLNHTIIHIYISNCELQYEKVIKGTSKLDHKHLKYQNGYIYKIKSCTSSGLYSPKRQCSMVIINTLYTVLSLTCQIFIIWAYLTRRHVHIEGLA